MSGCALFSVTIKNPDRCRICSVASGDGTEGSLEILPGPAITRGTWRVCMSGAPENYVARLAGPLIRATRNLRLKSQSPVTLRYIIRCAT
jgi:hypothetical protein